MKTTLRTIYVVLLCLIFVYDVALAIDPVSLPGSRMYGHTDSGPDFMVPVQNQDTYWFDKLSSQEKGHFLSLQCPEWDTVYHNYVLDNSSKTPGKISVMGYCCAPLKEDDIYECYSGKPCVGRVHNIQVRKVNGKPLVSMPKVCRYRGPKVCDIKLKSLTFKKGWIGAILGMFIDVDSLMASSGQSTPCFVKKGSKPRHKQSAGKPKSPKPTPSTPQKPPSKPNPPRHPKQPAQAYGSDKLPSSPSTPGSAASGHREGNHGSQTSGHTGQNTAGTGHSRPAVNPTRVNPPTPRGHRVYDYRTPQERERALQEARDSNDQRYGFYKDRPFYNQNTTQAQDYHPQGYRKDNRYFVPITFSRPQPTTGIATPFDDMFAQMQEEDKRAREAQLQKQNQNFADLFFNTLARVMTGDNSAKAEFQIIARPRQATANSVYSHHNKTNNFKTNTSLQFNSAQNTTQSSQIFTQDKPDNKEDILEIENEVAHAIAQSALEKATNEALQTKATTACTGSQTASRCMLYRIENARRKQREIYTEEIQNSSLSSSTKQYLIDIYDGKSNSENIPLLEEITQARQWTQDPVSKPILSQELQAKHQIQKPKAQTQKSSPLQNFFDSLLGWLGV